MDGLENRGDKCSNEKRMSVYRLNKSH